MSKSSKFGTFGGVFTPSVLTILGVIMYLRLPWVVGNSGLYVAAGVIGVAHDARAEPPAAGPAKWTTAPPRPASLLAKKDPAGKTGDATSPGE
jgi:hypothetical protein